MKAPHSIESTSSVHYRFYTSWQQESYRRKNKRIEQTEPREPKEKPQTSYQEMLASKEDPDDQSYASRLFGVLGKRTPTITQLVEDNELRTRTAEGKFRL